MFDYQWIALAIIFVFGFAVVYALLGLSGGTRKMRREVLPPDQAPEAWYIVLGVAPDASLAEIETAYRRKATEDFKGKPETESAAARIRLDQAYEASRRARGG
jgi:hypothetical protein